MASEVILQVTKSVPKDANIYNMVKEGQAVKEGDTLHGNTISKINNNGITFSNGNQISYNIAQ